MGRYSNVIDTVKSKEEIDDFIAKYLKSEGFTFREFRGENLWKKGSGLMTAPQFIKFEFSQGKVKVDAWLKYPLLPGVYVGEMGVKGFFGVVPKQLLKRRVDMIEHFIRT